MGNKQGKRMGMKEGGRRRREGGEGGRKGKEGERGKGCIIEKKRTGPEKGNGVDGERTVGHYAKISVHTFHISQ